MTGQQQSKLKAPTKIGLLLQCRFPIAANALLCASRATSAYLLRDPINFSLLAMA